MRPEDKRLDRALKTQWHKIFRTTGLLNDNIDWLDGPLNIGQIAIATGLGYTDFRIDDHQWRAGRPKLEAWFAEFNKRGSMQETFFARPGAKLEKRWRGRLLEPDSLPSSSETWWVRVKGWLRR